MSKNVKCVTVNLFRRHKTNEYKELVYIVFKILYGYAR